MKESKTQNFPTKKGTDSEIQNRCEPTLHPSSTAEKSHGEPMVKAPEDSQKESQKVASDLLQKGTHGEDALPAKTVSKPKNETGFEKKSKKISSADPQSFDPQAIDPESTEGQSVHPQAVDSKSETQKCTEAQSVDSRFQKQNSEPEEPKGEWLMLALGRVAKLNGTTAEDLVQALEQSSEQLLREELQQKFPDDPETAEKMFALYENEKQQQNARWQQEKEQTRQANEAKALENTRRENETLARQFEALQHDFPEVKSFEEVPDCVIEATLKNGSRLEAEFALFEAKSRKAAQKAAKTEQQAAESSPGTMRTTEANHQSETEKRFLNALWGR